jgi:hypothetical protein
MVMWLAVLARPAMADPTGELARLVTLDQSGKPAVVAASFGMGETELAKKGYGPKHKNFELDGGIRAWPELDANHRVDELDLRFEADYDATIALLEKQWGKATMKEDVMLAATLPRRAAIWLRPKQRVRAWAEGAAGRDVDIRFASYRPLDSVDFDKLLGANGMKISAIENRFGVTVELNEGIDGQTATFRIGYTEFGEISLHGLVYDGRVVDDVVVLMCPLGTMKRMLDRVRRRAPTRRLVPTAEDILEVHART